MESQLQQELETWPVGSVAAAVVRGGEVLAHHGPTGRVFELASVTKLLAAYGFLVAVEEGALELDQPCGPATVRHLLAHASGLGFRQGDRAREPGTRRIYSSYGFEVLAEALEAETGMQYSEYLREAMFAPLEMHSTELWGSPGHEARSTVDDLVRFSREVLSPTLLHESTVRTACSVQFEGLDGVVPGYGMQRPCPWGLGFELRGEKSPHWLGVSMPAEVAGHFGQSGTYLWVDRERGLAMVVLTDTPFGPWAVERWSKCNNEVWLKLK